MTERREDLYHRIEELQKSEERYRLLFNTVPVGIGITDRDGAILTVNKTLTEMMGYSQEEIGRLETGDVFFNPHDRKRIQGMLDRQGYVQNYIFDLKRREGTAYPVMVNIGQKRLGGTDVIIACVQDMTRYREMEKKQKLLQERLVQSQKMETVGTLSGSMAHDFNNILTAIKMSNDLALHKLEKTDSLYNDLMHVRYVTDYGANLTRQLMLYSRRKLMEIVPLNLNIVIKNALKMVRRVLDKSIEIQTDLEKGLLAFEGDAGTVKQAILNISVNARDAMPEGGTLTFRTGNVMINGVYARLHPEARRGKYVCLSIEDTGYGMDKATLNDIFEPFFTTKGPGKGTGLGLSIVQDIVREHKGWINVYADPGNGATFKLYFPATSKEAESGQETKYMLETLRGRGETILMVEDEKSVVDATERVLTEMGYRIRPAGTIREALDIYGRTEENIDLLFTDTVLPDGKGLDLIDTLRLKDPDLKVLLSSGYGEDKIHRDIIYKQEYLFIQKPYDLERLLIFIRKALAAEHSN